MVYLQIMQAYAPGGREHLLQEEVVHHKGGFFSISSFGHECAVHS